MGDVEGRRKWRVLLGVCGSVAAIKVPQLMGMMKREDEEKGKEEWEVRVVATDSARYFLKRADAVEPELTSVVSTENGDSEWVSTDESEWRLWEKRGDPVLHIDLRKWADILVLAPLSANTLAKMAAGICDNLLLSVCRAWEFRAGKPVILAPAMNTEMWNHPFTEKHLHVMKDLGNVVVVEPAVKTLACGDTGTGALANLSDIVEAVQEALKVYRDTQCAKG